MLKKYQVIGGSVAGGDIVADPLPEPISAALRELLFNVEVGRSTVILLLEALSHVGVILAVLLNVLFFGGVATPMSSVAPVISATPVGLVSFVSPAVSESTTF